MSLILNIDTAADSASVCLAEEGVSLALRINDKQADHAAWLHNSINEILKTTGINMSGLSAIAVNIGPGSYTGLRVGLSAAKGFCYALELPLITIRSLSLIALAAKIDDIPLICPLIDARRMEVFTALYNKELQEIEPPHALILEANSFETLLANNRVLFCGNGAKKAAEMIKNNNAVFSSLMPDAAHLAIISYNSYQRKDFASLAYAEPLYIKEFYSPPPKNKQQ